MSYSLCNLGDCHRLPGRPAFIPTSRPRGVKAKGLLFERRVGKILEGIYPRVYSGEWFAYSDDKRVGVCCIDHYAVLHSHIVLVECKLSEKDEAWAQMANLYAPILEREYSLPVSRVQAVRHLRTGRKLINDIRDARPGREHLWHLLV